MEDDKKENKAGYLGIIIPFLFVGIVLGIVLRRVK